MPEPFDKCRREGGRIRVITLKKGRYMRICYDKENKAHAGEVKQKQEAKT